MALHSYRQARCQPAQFIMQDPYLPACPGARSTEHKSSPHLVEVCLYFQLVRHP